MPARAGDGVSGEASSAAASGSNTARLAGEYDASSGGGGVRCMRGA